MERLWWEKEVESCKKYDFNVANNYEAMPGFEHEWPFWKSDALTTTPHVLDDKLLQITPTYSSGQKYWAKAQILKLSLFWFLNDWIAGQKTFITTVLDLFHQCQSKKNKKSFYSTCTIFFTHTIFGVVKSIGP